MTKRAIIYARVSTDDQRGNYSIPTQVAECVRYAQKKGYTIVGDSYIDPSSGLDISTTDGIRAYVDDYSSRELSRPSLDAALTYLETVGFDVVIVHALDRLARDPYVRRTLEMEFEKRGAYAEFVLGNYEQTPEGEVRKDLDATFAKWENAKRVERSKRGKRGKAEKGLFVGGRTPYGYVPDCDAPGGLAVDEEQAAVVRRIFDLYIHRGYSIRQIADELSVGRIMNHSGRTDWGKTSIARILANPTYAGTNYYNKFKRTNNGRKLITRDGDKWIAIKVTPLVEQYLFEEAGRRLAWNRDRVRKQPKRTYLLAGMLLCADCNRPFMGQTLRAGTGDRVKDDICYRHRASHGHCRNKQIAAHKLDSAVWNAIVDLLLDAERLRAGYEKSLERQREKQSHQRSHLEQLGQRRVNLEQQTANLTVAYVDPDIRLSKDEYLRQRTIIQNELTAVQEAMNEIESELTSIPTETDYATFAAFSAKIREKLQANVNPSTEEKRTILQRLHVQVYVDIERSELSVEGWFDAKEAGLSSITY